MRIRDDYTIAKNLLVAITSFIFIVVILGAIASFLATIMKLTGAINWNWWHVLAPVVIPFCAEAAEAVLLTIWLLISSAIERNKDDNKVQA